jgi:N6-L-threonylcarbamoyladenine synthase
MLVAVAAIGEYDVLGSTLDDAAGEAFDKTAKLLGLEYPGGPALAKLAEAGNPSAIDLPRPMISRSGFDFSFSGLKTAVMLKVREATDAGTIEETRADIAASFQQAVVDTLVSRTLKAARHLDSDRLIIAGGVGANKALRDQLQRRFDGRVYYPRTEYCTDNGAMIAMAGALRLHDGMAPDEISATARWPLQELLPPAA